MVAAIYRFLGRHARRGVEGAIALVGVLFVLHRWLPEYLPHALRLTANQTLSLGLFFVLLDRVMAVEEAVKREAASQQSFWRYETREMAYEHVCSLLRERGRQV